MPSSLALPHDAQRAHLQVRHHGAPLQHRARHRIIERTDAWHAGGSQLIAPLPALTASAASVVYIRHRATSSRSSARYVSSRKARKRDWDLDDDVDSLPMQSPSCTFKVGSVLRVPNSPLAFKVVRELGSDWRGYQRARLRVVKGGLHRGKFWTVGSMFRGKLMPTAAAEDTLDAHRALTGYWGKQAQVISIEGMVFIDSVTAMVLYEDFGRSMLDFLRSGKRPSDEDADKCAADLLRALSAMHKAGLHHLALSPDCVLLQRDGLGRLRLKLSNLGVSEQPKCPFPDGYSPLRNFSAPEVLAPGALQRLGAAARTGVSRAGSHNPAAKALPSDLRSLELLPSPCEKTRKGGDPPVSKPGYVRELLSSFNTSHEVSDDDIAKLSADLDGPFYVPPGHVFFHEGDVGDYMYFILAGEIQTRRGKKQLDIFGPGCFFGDAALLDRQPVQRITTATASKDVAGGCAVLRLGHKSFRRQLKSSSFFAEFVTPSKWNFLVTAQVPDAQPKAADIYSAAAVWVHFVTGSSALWNAPLTRIRRATSMESLRAAVATRDLGYYFILEERRMLALINMALRRSMADEALLCLEEADDSLEEESEDSSTSQNPVAWFGKLVGDAQQAVQRGAEGLASAEATSDAVLLSTRVGSTLGDRVGRWQNLATNRYGRVLGEFLGELYGALFAKDLFWMFRSSSRIPRFPVRMVRDAERGNVLARWQLGVSSAFECELCTQTWPRLRQAVKPAFISGFQIGAAIGRNRAINFKILWVDAFLKSILQHLGAQLRIMWRKLRGGSQKGWDDVRAVLKDAMIRGRSARRNLLLQFGRLPTTYDQNAPQVLKLLPNQWVPDVGIPLASGVGRGFFEKLGRGWKKGRRQRYVRPRFETWDVDNDVPKFMLEFARTQGAEQAGLVAASAGDTLARGLGWHLGSLLGVGNGFIRAFLGRVPAPESRHAAVAGGFLRDQEEVMELAWLEREEDFDSV
mmetsp:Transcript_39849/g.89356  ORF Transcript_39849/g.89356 Transcript_39849/m.89356 type:complete len:972 (+) Transcript_39849:21-2936(+)